MEKRDRIYAISLFGFSLFRRFFSLGMMNSKFSLISDFVCSLSGTAILFRGNVLISWAADSPPKRYFIRYYNTPCDITISRLDFSVWKRMKNLAINLQPLIYGAFSVCRNCTVRAHLRNADTVKRCGCENRQQYAGSLRRGIHPPHLHPRYKVEARRGSTNNGQFQGAGHASRKRTQKCRREDKAFSPVLFKSIRTFPRAPSQRAPCRGRHGYSLRLAAGHGSAIAFRRPLCVDAVVG